jgi:hypothetical protein
MLLAQLTRQNADENTDENSGYAASPRHPALRRVATMLNRLQRGRSLFSPLARFPRSTSDQQERGAMMMLLAGNIVALVASGAVALDLSARMNSAQHLQNAADAASLAGVLVWVDTADETATRAKVAEMTEQNGVDRPDIVVDVTFVDSTTIAVNLTQDSTTGFLAIGLLGDLNRIATASFDRCSATCGGTILIPEPFLPIDAAGSGDGFVPSIVGTKLYGVNHHSDTMACVDRVTQSACFEDGNLFNDISYTTDWT